MDSKPVIIMTRTLLGHDIEVRFGRDKEAIATAREFDAWCQERNIYMTSRLTETMVVMRGCFYRRNRALEIKMRWG